MRKKRRRRPPPHKNRRRNHDPQTPREPASAPAALSVFRALQTPFFKSWRPTVATVTGLVAKEEVVGTFGVLYNYDDADGEAELEENGDQIWANVAADFNAFYGGHGMLAAFAFMLFNLLCAPCFAAIGAIKREMNSAKQIAGLIAAVVLLLPFPFSGSLMAFQNAFSIVSTFCPSRYSYFMSSMLFFTMKTPRPPICRSSRESVTSGSGLASGS